MPKIGIGCQDFETIRQNNHFYIDKTAFIRDWWTYGDAVTLITRPRRFGKTLMMSTVNVFFSADYAGRADLFEALDIWRDPDLRKLQGSFPTLFVSFADIKESTAFGTKKRICQIIEEKRG